MDNRALILVHVMFIILGSIVAWSCFGINYLAVVVPVLIGTYVSITGFILIISFIYALGLCICKELIEAYSQRLKMIRQEIGPYDIKDELINSPKSAGSIIV